MFASVFCWSVIWVLGHNCHEICQGWIGDIWYPNGPGVISDHENRNPEEGSQDTQMYTGETTCLNFFRKHFGMVF